MELSNLSQNIILSAGLFGSIYINAISITEINKLLLIPTIQFEYNAKIIPCAILNGIIFSSSSLMIAFFSINAVKILYKKY